MISIKKIEQSTTKDLFDTLEYHRISGNTLSLVDMLNIETELEKRQLPNNEWLENRSKLKC